MPAVPKRAMREKFAPYAAPKSKSDSPASPAKPPATHRPQEDVDQAPTPVDEPRQVAFERTSVKIRIPARPKQPLQLRQVSFQRTGLKIRLPARPKQPLATEASLVTYDLEARNCTHRELPLSLDGVLNPPEEKEIGDTDGLAADISNKAIASTVLSEIARTNEEDVQSDKEGTDQAGPACALTNAQVQELCKEELECTCLELWDGESALQLLKLLRAFRSHERRAQIKANLHSYFSTL
ncbi:hypothetical protein K503DRAFT_801397 [Rhizopogon vinicolor AM-OR11-026]|uniref:Uncharacterized protein n=1 Tax=Rhizopogon vinicolor AM-OR11-026 TaxID=1314800 RepID=A0A1B7MXA2_9AGAM|nr:hypothetical protein K503DRAFT_801397 [Rhizopogon vinicolor AM-OR11-026]